jgi:hypothetical protein
MVGFLQLVGRVCSGDTMANLAHGLGKIIELLRISPALSRQSQTSMKMDQGPQHRLAP